MVFFPFLFNVNRLGAYAIKRIARTYTSVFVLPVLRQKETYNTFTHECILRLWMQIIFMYVHKHLKGVAQPVMCLARTCGRWPWRRGVYRLTFVLGEERDRERM
uniref:Uncharacterized protein n=1 Tax=Sipha flava TaxID=143950 RepID=A0A2S2Q1D8_9HEMI